jgi:hypothetical protein
VVTLYTLYDLTKRMSEKSSLRRYQPPEHQPDHPEIDKGLLYPMLGQDLKSCWGQKFLSLQPRGYLRRLCTVVEKFLNGYP